LLRQLPTKHGSSPPLSGGAVGAGEMAEAAMAVVGAAAEAPAGASLALGVLLQASKPLLATIANTERVLTEPLKFIAASIAQPESGSIQRRPFGLDVRWDVEGLINVPTTMLIGIVLVVFSFNLAVPISQLASTVTRATLGIAMASVMLAFLMMITRRKAIPQVIGFLAMENGLFFAATSATYGMPMVVELGVALDVLVGMLILGVFFFQIREQFDSLDLKHLEKLKE
jgi:hydrogenase-4 membrane subunit HyfE